MIQPPLRERLRALAEHPSTTPAERDNAMRRIAEIDAKIASDPPPEPPIASGPFPWSTTVDTGNAYWRSGRDKILTMRNRAKTRTLPTRWPFGWDGPRTIVEREVGSDGRGGIAVGWQCPSCGTHVERHLSASDIKRMSPPGRPNLVERHIEHMIDGTMNQLCLACWDRMSE